MTLQAYRDFPAVAVWQRSRSGNVGVWQRWGLAALGSDYIAKIVNQVPDNHHAPFCGGWGHPAASNDPLRKGGAMDCRDNVVRGDGRHTGVGSKSMSAC